MNKTLLLAAAAACSCALAFGQAPVVSLQNQEDSTFYYVVDPPELAGLTAGSPLLASTVAAYFSAGDAAPTFASLAPQGEARLAGLTVGSHLLVGFFEQQEADDFPVRVIALQADSSVGERFYAVFASPAQLSVRRGVGKLAQFARSGAVPGTAVASSSTAVAAPTDQAAGTAVTGSADQTAAAPVPATADQAAGAPVPAATDQAATGATALPTLAAFSPTYDPAVFSRESSDGFKVLPIAESHAWTQAATRIASVQGTLDSQGLKLVLNVPGGFSPSVSYFLYVFDARDAGRENSLTLEIEPMARGAKGACILWQKGSDPRLFGTVKTSSTAVELDADNEDLAKGVLAAAGSAPTVDLTAGSYDGAQRTWEEFYYTTFPASVTDATR